MRDNSFFANFFFEKSDESDFSDFELHRKINGFAGFTEQKLLKLKADLKLKMPLKELAALRRRFGGKNTPTVMALKILDDYRSSARALFTEEINEIRLTNKNPHIMKALKKYEELKKRFSPYTPRNISELGMMNLNAAANEKDSVFIGAGKAQTECETFDKGRRVGYYTMLVTKWDDGEGLKAERRAAVETALAGYVTEAFFTEADNSPRATELKEYAGSLAVSPFGFLREGKKLTKVTALGISEVPRFGPATAELGDKIILVEMKDTERASLKMLRELMQEAGTSIKRALNNDIGFLNSLFLLNAGFDIDISAVGIFAETGEELVLGKRADRVTFVVRRGKSSQVAALAEKHGMKAAVVGRFTGRRRFRLMNKGAELTALELSAVIYADHEYRHYVLDSEAEPFRIFPAPDDLKINLKNLSETGELNGVDGGKCVVGVLSGAAQSTETEAGVILPRFNGYGNAVNAVTVAENSPGGDVFTRAVNTALNAVMKLVASGISIYNIQLNPAYILPEGEFDKGELLENALGVFYLENALSLNSLGYGAERSSTVYSPELKVQATGYSGDGRLIPGLFQNGHKLYKIGIPRDEFGIPDFKFILQLAAQISINASTGNLLAARLISTSVPEAVIAGTAGERLGFSFSGRPSAQGENLSELLLALEDADEFSAFDPEYIGVVDNSGRIKSALFNYTHSELTRSVSRYPFESRPDQRCPAAPVSQKAAAVRSRVSEPKLMIIHDDFASEGALVRVAIDNGFKPTAVRIQRDYPLSNENLRSIRERVSSSDMLVIAGRNADGIYSNGGKIQKLLLSPVVTDAVNELIYRNEGLILGTGLGAKILAEMGLLTRGSTEYAGASGVTFSPSVVAEANPKLPGIRISNRYSPMMSEIKLGGRYLTARGGSDMCLRVSGEYLGELQASGQIAAQFVDPMGMPTSAFPFNPDGSDMAIAALSSPDGRVLGFFCLPEKTAFLKGSGNLVNGLFASSARYFGI